MKKILCDNCEKKIEEKDYRPISFLGLEINRSYNLSLDLCDICKGRLAERIKELLENKLKL